MQQTCSILMTKKIETLFAIQFANTIYYENLYCIQELQYKKYFSIIILFLFLHLSTNFGNPNKCSVYAILINAKANYLEIGNYNNKASESLSVKEEQTPTLVNLTVIAVIVAIAIPIIIYVLQQWIDKRDRIRRSCHAVIRELSQNKIALTDNKYKHIKYKLDKLYEDKIKYINYTNVYLESDAYQSVLNSGLFTHFSIDTQNSLTSLYARISSRNELITYVDHYEDTFFIFHNLSDNTLKTWYSKIEKYDILLTEWESEIYYWIDKVELLLNIEMPKKII